MFEAGFSFAEIAPFILIGFVAQVIDGALGMAFGVISQTMLVSLMGVPPAAASASTHLVEIFTTGTSGASHIWQRNVDWKLMAYLAPFGMIGGFLGATVLSNIDASVARPWVMLYLTGVGFYLLLRAIRHRGQRKLNLRRVPPLAVAGGFLDAAGGGGWGPVVTSNLLIQGGEPGKVIGTVNTTEFLLAVSISVAFLATIGVAAFGAITLGMAIGGVVAAPLGAIVARRVPARALLFAVSLVLIATSLFSIARAWWGLG